MFEPRENGSFALMMNSTLTPVYLVRCMPMMNYLALATGSSLITINHPGSELLTVFP